SFHFGSLEHRIVGMISHLGPQLGIADGIALACKLAGEQKVTLVVTGDGGASEGDFHEALNVAAVWNLPVIFLVENNQWGLSTPSAEQFKCKSFIDKGIGYGMQAVQCYGNNLLEVYHTVAALSEEIRFAPKPVILECLTFRMRGHEEASGTKYYPVGLQEAWEKEDPVINYEQWLLQQGYLSASDVEGIRQEFKQLVADKFETAYAMPPVEADTQSELDDVFAVVSQQPIAPSEAATPMRLVDAVQDGLREAMRRHPKLVLMGQDIAAYGGVFKVTEGFLEEFGPERVRNTPLCESAIVGASLGLSLKGFKAMMEMQFADFASSGFNQIVNNLAKIHWRWGANADVVIRMPTGAGVAAGPFHSQSNEAWFFHVPGLKIVYPAFPAQAKGLLLAAFEDPNPVMFFEHKALYRSISENVPSGYYTLEIGKAHTVTQGNDFTVITYGMGVHWALDLAGEFEGRMELLDLVALAPLDWDAVYAAVNKTGRVLVLHEDNQTGGIGAEVASRIAEQCFEHLDAPVLRLASIDTPVPFATVLENNYLPKGRLQQKIEELLRY
ncbi:MAG: dehydrogenase E1 component subunit alpha/beta, partial [Flavobacteriales bacterium]|nr:dehydrogenase E1 component subunit alpha/beta [Flavobacteriales bacterium]